MFLLLVIIFNTKEIADNLQKQGGLKGAPRSLNRKIPRENRSPS